MRVLGVDFGRQRIGIAVGELEFGIATARPPLAASGALARDADAIAQLAKEEGAERIALGLPLNPEGEDDRAARICATLADHLRERGWAVELVDESLTTAESHAALAEAGVRAAARRRQVDGESARRILLRYFEAHG